jgi:DNA-binding winged helix-turn-helix (wHTH) protein
LLYFFNDFALDTDRRELRRGPKLVSIAPQVFDLVEYLIRNRERVVSKDDLLASIWNGRIVSDSALNTRINAARCAIDDTGEHQRLIRTLPRKGVRFIGAVREERKAASVSEPEEALAEHPSAALTLPDRPSIAVLPFANLSGGPSPLHGTAHRRDIGRTYLGRSFRRQYGQRVRSSGPVYRKCCRGN